MTKQDEEVTKPDTPLAKKGVKPCCGPTGDRVAMIKQVSTALVQGHQGLAFMYDQLEKDFASQPEEAKAFREAAAKQRVLAEASANVTVPED